jgi:cysteine desulfurase
LPAIVGGGVAAEAAKRDLAARKSHTARLQRLLWEGLSVKISHVALNGADLGPQRLSTNLNVSALGAEGEGLVLSLDMGGVAVASGATCASKSVKLSPVLQAMGLSQALTEAAVVFSLGKDTTDVEIDQAVAAYAKAVERLRSFSMDGAEARLTQGGAERATVSATSASANAGH